jgi:hypothetical protein
VLTLAPTDRATFLFTEVEDATLLWEDYAADVEGYWLATPRCCGRCRRPRRTCFRLQR